MNQLRLDTAIKCGWIECWYQPKIDLRRRQLRGVEAFARVRHPQLGVLSAAEVLITASADEATALSENALISVLRTSDKLRELGMNDLSFAINFDLVTLSRFPVAGTVRQHCGLAANPNLIFDITEKQVMRNIPIIHQLETELKRNGFRLAIDDFGSAFLAARETDAALDRTFSVLSSKLKLLTDGRFGEMKLAPSIVHDLNASDRKRQICGNLISLAHSMGSTAVAIGIEKKEELDILKEMKCDIGQGILLGGPMPEEVLIASVQRRAVKRAKSRRVAA